MKRNASFWFQYGAISLAVVFVVCMFAVDGNTAKRRNEAQSNEYKKWERSRIALEADESVDAIRIQAVLFDSLWLGAQKLPPETAREFLVQVSENRRIRMIQESLS